MIVTKQPESFDIKEKLIEIKSQNGGKNFYLPVQWRLVWFREICPNGQIKTNLIHLDLQLPVTIMVPVWEKNKIDHYVEKMDLGLAIFKAEIETPEGACATGHKKEERVSFLDFIEKAETGSMGRALAALGYGTQFSDQEFLEGEGRPADAPVAAGNKPKGSQIKEIQRLSGLLNQKAPWANTIDEAEAIIQQLKEALGQTSDPVTIASDTPLATPQQIKAIKNLCEMKRREVPNNINSLTNEKASDLISQLTKIA